MEINPNDLTNRDLYKLMTGSIVPRPIAWVSTLSQDGIPNLAPFSYFTAVCSQPPTIAFAPGVRSRDSSQKDTYNNIRERGEFIVNFVTESLADAMNITATEASPEVNEFERAGLTAVLGATVAIPRVKESPIHFECKLNQIVTISNEPGGGHLVLGTVVHFYVDDALLQEGYVIDIPGYQPIGRLSGSAYSRVNDLFDLQRPKPEIR